MCGQEMRVQQHAPPRSDARMASSLATVKPLGGIGTVQTSKLVKIISRIGLVAEDIKQQVV